MPRGQGKKGVKGNLLSSRPCTITLPTSTLGSTRILYGLDGISWSAKKTLAVYVPTVVGSNSMRKVLSWLSMVLTGMSRPRSLVSAIAMSPTQHHCWSALSPSLLLSILVGQAVAMSATQHHCWSALSLSLLHSIIVGQLYCYVSYTASSHADLKCSKEYIRLTISIKFQILGLHVQINKENKQLF